MSLHSVKVKGKLSSSMYSMYWWRNTFTQVHIMLFKEKMDCLDNKIVDRVISKIQLVKRLEIV
jgi:hypothetical protein